MKRLIFVIFLALVSFSCDSGGGLNLPEGVVGAWFFSGNLEDASKSGIDATIGAGTPGYVTDRFGNPGSALSLISASDFINIAGYEAINTTPDGMSVSFWVSQTGTDGRVISRRNGEGATSWELDIITSYTYFRLGFDGGTVGSNHSISTYFTETMNHVVLIFDVVNTSWKIYVNKVSAYSNSSASGDIQTTNPIRIGYTGLSGITGQFDDLILFNRAITEEEVSLLYDYQP